MADLQRFLEELRAKVSIVDVVGAKVKLIRKGREYHACCPFHNEKTPSFTVNEAKGFYHCFGCGAHGDIIKFEMEANNLPFMEAVEKLANKAGLQVPRDSYIRPEEVEKKNSLYDIMDLACKFFEKNLRMPEGMRALEYLSRRGFGDDIIAKFRLGYSPNNNGLKTYLSGKGVADKEMNELGLLTVPEDKNRRPHDFFRDRVMIPIMDKRGRVIAFGGRIMGDGQPKYLNSPETPIFNKRRILYNLNNARDAGFQEKKLIICEGYMDVIGMDNYGIHHAVAPLGTALTEEQIQEAWRVVNEPTCCFDGDMAGKRAAIRSVDRALPILKAGYSLKYVFLSGAKDPDEFLKTLGREAFDAAISETVPLKELLWKKNIEGMKTSTPEQKALVEKNIKEEVAKIADETVRNYYAQDMQDKIYDEIGKGASWRARRQNQQKSGEQASASAYGRRQPYKRRNEPDYHQAALATPKVALDELVAKYVVSALVCYPNLIEEYEEKLMNFSINNEELRHLLDSVFDIAMEGEAATFEEMLEALKKRGLEKTADKLLEFKMLRQQNPNDVRMRENIDLRIVESQLCQLDSEIKDCLRQLQNSESFSEEAYKRYESLKKARESLINSQDFE